MGLSIIFADDPGTIIDMVTVATSDPFNYKDTLLLMGNMFAYCSNNAVNHSDPSGYWVPDFIKNLLKTLLHSFFEDLRRYTITNVVLGVASLFMPFSLTSVITNKLGLGARAIRYTGTGSIGIISSIKSISIGRKVLDKIATFFISKGISKITGVIQNLTIKKFDSVTALEKWFDNTEPGKYLDNSIYWVENQLASYINKL